MTTIAVVIPNLNGAVHLRATLESIRKQSCPPDEIIFSDNFSEDESLEIVRDFSDLQIDIVSPPLQLSMSAHWNFAIANSTSEWFVLLSSDDLLRENMIKELRKDLKKLKTHVGIISYRAEIINEESQIIIGKYAIGRSRISDEYAFLRQNIRNAKINVAATAINREVYLRVGGYPEKYRYIHDLVFYQKVAHESKILLSRKVLGQYRIYQKTGHSESRIKETSKDFVLYENTDLPQVIQRYPDLIHIYKDLSTGLSDSSKLNARAISRKALLQILTLCRTIQLRMGISGFPSSISKSN